MVSKLKLAALPLALLFSTSALAADASGVLTGEAAFGGWKADKPGIKRLLKPGDLPAPTLGESASNRPETIRMPEGGAKPQLPEGFSAEMIASEMVGPRVVRVAPNGDLFVANSKANQVVVYRMKDGGTEPAEHQVFAESLNQPYGIAFYPLGDNPEWVYVANEDSVVRFPYQNGDLKASGEGETIITGLPVGRHWTRDLAFSPDGKTLFVSVGSGSNVAEEMPAKPAEGDIAAVEAKFGLGATWGPEERRAAVLAFNPDGSGGRNYANGLRNCSGMTIQPATGALWCVVNERDEIGNNVPFEYATTVAEGGFYGWPWYYIGGNEDPRLKGQRPDLADKVTVPDVLMQAHSAPLNLAFYDATAFPAEYRGDAFVAMHGSWNRDTRTGYKVVRLHFDGDKPTGVYEDFMTGFVLSDDEVWGRPVGIAVGKDGALYVSEDGSGTIWRITYSTPGPS